MMRLAQIQTQTLISPEDGEEIYVSAQPEFHLTFGENGQTFEADKEFLGYFDVFLNSQKLGRITYHFLVIPITIRPPFYVLGEKLIKILAGDVIISNKVLSISACQKLLYRKIKRWHEK